MDQNHVDVTKISTEIYEYLRYSQRSSSQISLNTSASFETRNISNDLLKFMKLRIGIGSLQNGINSIYSILSNDWRLESTFRPGRPLRVTKDLRGNISWY